MRLPVIVLTLLLFAAIPIGSGEDPPEFSSNPFPPVQWTLDIDAGYISTAPLVSDGLVIVKAGGDPARNLPAGLYAYRADTGDSVWFAPHNASTSGYETSPLIVTNYNPNQDSEHLCRSRDNIIITGWTSGQLTAHDFGTGQEVWTVQTESPHWGITGGGLLHNNGTIWATETGMVMICDRTGVTLSSLESNQTTYRASVGSSHSPNGFGLGTETGHLLVANLSDSNDLSSATYSMHDLPEIANITGTWKIRSALTSPGNMDQLKLVHLNGLDDSRVLLLEIHPNGTVELLDIATIPTGTSTSSMAITGTSDGVYQWSTNSSHSLIMNHSWSAQNVIGEITHIDYDGGSWVCLPQNHAHGTWLLVNSNSSIEWAPQVPQYVTAGCSSDGMVIAAANDASWLEVRYAASDLATIQALANQHSNTISQESPTEDESDEIPGVIWVPLCGATLVLCIAFVTPNHDLRRQIIITGLLLMIVALMIIAPILTKSLAGIPQEDSSERTKASQYADWNQDENMVSIAFHFPADVSQPICENGLTHHQGTAVNEYIISETEVCILVVSVDSSGVSTVADATLEALNILQIEYQTEAQVLGLFIHSIGDVEGGDGDNWWTYDLNGGYGTVGPSDQSVISDDEIDWHFDNHGY
ncbi:MAG: DUF4430 domain-containing protein [Candidatus Thalassarchaeaceae archaeon]|nr:DUF4430 domain-containing protein [Candidatus Thalassarchaeaceae archaeon]